MKKINDVIDYTINCGTCLKCKGLLEPIRCPICKSRQARRTIDDFEWECDKGHIYIIIDMIDTDVEFW